MKAGIFSSILMAVIYLLVTVMGAQSRGILKRRKMEEQLLPVLRDIILAVPER